METKTCRVCSDDKPVEEFNKDRTKPDGRRNICRSCRSTTERSNVRKITSAKSQQEQEVFSPEQKVKHIAYQRAMKRLIEMYPREFHQLVSKEMTYLGAEKRWRTVSG